MILPVDGDILLPPGPPEQGVAAADWRERICVFGMLILSLAALVWISQKNYILFHSLAEIYNMVVCWGVFFLAWNAHRLIRDSYLCVLGISYFFVGFLLLLHMLAWKGMGVFQEGGANLATQLWVAVRLLHALAFATASICLFHPRHSLRPLTIIAPFILIFTLASLALIFNGLFPICFVEGSGLTPFKKASELLADMLFGLSGILTWRRRKELEGRVLRLLLTSILLTMLAGGLFMLYERVDGLANLLGHCFSVSSTYCLFRAFIHTGIITPQAVLFQELQRRQDELERIKAGLEQQVRTRTQDLDQKNKELAESNQRLDEFAYSISHDLREPLRGMHNFAYILSEEHGSRLDEDGQSLLVGIMRLARRLDSQVLAVLKCSRLGRLEPEIQPTDLNILLDEVLDGLSSLIAAQAARIERDQPPLPHILCHGEHVREIFHNLIANGIIYNDNPEKLVTVGWHRPNVRPDGLPLADSGVPVFYVRDNGIGIPEKHFQKIFDIFKRLHGHDKYGGGTGVGLTIAKQVVERHGGQIALVSEPGRGTTFYFTLSAGR